MASPDFEQIINEGNEEIKLPFNDVFELENTKIGNSYTAKIACQINGVSFDRGKLIIGESTIAGIPISDIQGKIFVGYKTNSSNTFFITRYEDAPQEN